MSLRKNDSITPETLTGEAGEQTSDLPLTPNQELALAVVNELVGAGLLGAGRIMEVVEKIGQGKASQTDWRMWAEDQSIDNAEDRGGDADNPTQFASI